MTHKSVGYVLHDAVLLKANSIRPKVDASAPRLIGATFMEFHRATLVQQPVKGFEHAFDPTPEAPNCEFLDDLSIKNA